jgi:ubiquinone/menaquinone biosynthesis C-methylase UbiE
MNGAMAGTLPHEFSDVDRSADPSTLAAYLDAVGGAVGMQQLKRQTYALLALRSGDRVLDVGCGTGRDDWAMAQLVGPTGRSVGIDSSSYLIDLAAARWATDTLPYEFRLGQAEQLEFADETFDACRAERVLAHVTSPDRAVAEMIRVLRPGGRLVCFEPDFDLQVFDAPDRQLTRAVCQFRTDQMTSGTVGRQLRRIFLAKGLIDVEVTPMANAITDLAVANTLMGLSNVVEGAVRSGAITPDDGRRWWAGLEAADRAGQFLATSVAFLVSGRRPAA